MSEIRRNATSTDVTTAKDKVTARSSQAGRVEHFTVDERAARGKAARAEVPRSAHAAWEPVAAPSSTPPACSRSSAGCRNWYGDVTSGVPAKQFVRGEWFVGIGVVTGLFWVVVYWLIVQHGGASVWWPTLISFGVGYTLAVLALYRGWEEPLASEPAGVYKRNDGRPLLGRKIAGKSQRELRDPGLLVEDGDRDGQVPVGAGTH